MVQILFLGIPYFRFWKYCKHADMHSRAVQEEPLSKDLTVSFTPVLEAMPLELQRLMLSNSGKLHPWSLLAGILRLFGGCGKVCQDPESILEVGITSTLRSSAILGTDPWRFVFFLVYGKEN